MYDPAFATAPIPAWTMHDPRYLPNPDWDNTSTWPEWFCDVHSCLDQLPLPIPYKSLLAVLTQFEAKHDFLKIQSKKPPTSHRPTEVALWIKNARKCASAVPEDHIDGIQSEFWQWWKSAQPLWRRTSEIDMPLADEHRGCTGDWSTLNISGQNGVVSFVACLGFWGVADSGANWHLAVADVLWVLCCMLEAMD